MSSKRINQIQSILNDYINYLEVRGEKISDIELAWVKIHAESALVKNSEESISNFKKFIEREKRPKNEKILAGRGISVQIMDDRIKIFSS